MSLFNDTINDTINSTLTVETYPDLTATGAGYAALLIFMVGFILVIFEQQLGVNKTIPVCLSAFLIWLILALTYKHAGYGYYLEDGTFEDYKVEHGIYEGLREFCTLFLFLLVAMTYVNIMEERLIFDALRCFLVRKGLSFRVLFWVTGILTFYMSSCLDNCTTALVMGTVVITVGEGFPQFIAMSLVSVVIASNAGGAWCAFGDVTTLMIWQDKRLEFLQFFGLMPSSILNWAIPAAIMTFFIPKVKPLVPSAQPPVKRGGYVVMALFGVSVACAVLGEDLIGIPPFFGMVFGLAVCMLYSKCLGWFPGKEPHVHHPESPRLPEAVITIQSKDSKGKKSELELVPTHPPEDEEEEGEHDKEGQTSPKGKKENARLLGAAAQPKSDDTGSGPASPVGHPSKDLVIATKQDPSEAPESETHVNPLTAVKGDPFDFWEILRKAEWDTLLYFFGIMMSVRALAQMGYLDLLLGFLFEKVGVTITLATIGIFSAIVGNIPCTLAVLACRPNLTAGQWLLFTEAAGVGGSLLSIGSAAGVPLMGRSRRAYTFGYHFKWVWAILIGYAFAIGEIILQYGLGPQETILNAW